MSAQITLTIPDEVYQRAKRIARRKRQNVETILTEALAQSATLDEEKGANGEARFAEGDTAVAQEKTAYLAMYAHLWQTYPGHHVAIYGGQLVDHDRDGLALSRRIYEKYPDQFALIRQVEAEPDRVLRFRSPRFIEEA